MLVLRRRLLTSCFVLLLFFADFPVAEREQDQEAQQEKCELNQTEEMERLCENVHIERISIIKATRNETH